MSDVALRIGEERIPSDEAETIATMLARIQGVLEQQYPAGTRPFRRDAHPKSHGLVKAHFEVHADLPAEYRYGLFQRPAIYDAWIRFSSATGPIQTDTRPDAQGMAIKLLRVSGEKLPPYTSSTTHDLIVVNYPTFNASDPQQFLHMLGPEREAFFREHPELVVVRDAVYSQMVANPLQLRYWSMTPYKLGPGAMKFSARRVDSPLDARPVVPGSNALREAMVDELSRHDVVFDFMIQLQCDAQSMPIEDALVLWDESIAPFVNVATIRIPRQSFDSEAQRKYGDDLAFSPWNALPEHRPLGGINRARQQIYAAIAALRYERNGTRPLEPAALIDFD